MPADCAHNPEYFRALWERKPALRAVYHDIYRRILTAVAPGPILEIGGGSGNLKSFAPSITSTDVVFSPWLDVVCDAQRLPFPEGQFSNAVMVDVLHHIERPVNALLEVQRILRPGGRLIMCEPAITPLSGPMYRMFHAEPVDMTTDPLTDGPLSSGRRDPFESNQAIPTLLVTRDRERLARALPRLELRNAEWFSFLCYPLSGGFQSWSALPSWLAGPLLAIEWRTRKLLGRVAGFRLLAVYEKRS